MNEKEQIFLKIKSLLPSLNKALKQIADYVVNNPKEIKYLRIKDLAEASQVSEASVTRFVQLLGFSNYHEFKILLAELTKEETKKEEFVYEDVTKNDNIENIINKIVYMNIEALKNTQKILVIQEIEKAIDILYNARNLDIYGAGGSFVTAENARLRFYRIGKRCNIYNDPNQQIVSASLLNAKDAALGISNSGRTESTVLALKKAHENGANTICLTNYSQSPITRYADVRLFTSTEDSPFFKESMLSRVATIVLIDILYAGVALKQPEETLEMIEKSGEAIIKCCRIE
jgi:DNA-binding MurR/RpiR family transcriptional regulator